MQLPKTYSANIPGACIAAGCKNFRYAAYRSFINLIYGKLGKKRRKVIPCCAVLAIRRTFPEENGVYEGFHEVSISLGVNSF